MKTPRPLHPVARPPQPAPGFVQWDAPPSLSDSLSWRLQRAGEHNGPAFNFADTVPAALMANQPTTPFSEPVEGLSVREIRDDDLFVHLFGRPSTD